MAFRLNGKSMKDHLLPLLESSFNYILKGGSLPLSWREAFISVILKDGKDRVDCKGYRPVSVLKSDYKLYATILTKRMEPVMPLLIDEDQTGFIKNRQTQYNIRRALHIIERISKDQINAIILSLDAEKAFESVGWVFLYRVMEKFGFSKEFIQCIQALYSSRIKVNGSLSYSITLQRGCRQGCPLSPNVFNLFNEPLVQTIRQETGLNGIFVRGVEYKISLYADDAKDPNSGLPLLMKMLETYGEYSGYVLNVHKTQVMTFNYTLTTELSAMYNFNWNSSYIKYLGVNLPKDISQLFNNNYICITKKIYGDLDGWSLLPLDFGSRIKSIKMNILPRLLYLFLSLPVEIPSQQFTEWNKHISRFIWNEQRPRVKFSTLRLPDGRGGKALPYLRDYYLAAQLRSLVCWCNPCYVAKWKLGNYL